MWGDCEFWNRGNDIDGYCGWSIVMNIVMVMVQWDGRFGGSFLFFLFLSFFLFFSFFSFPLFPFPFFSFPFFFPLFFFSFILEFRQILSTRMVRIMTHVS